MIGNEHHCDDIIASALHPRYKKLKFLAMIPKSHVQERLEELCSQVPQDNIVQDKTDDNNVEVSLPKKVKRES